MQRLSQPPNDPSFVQDPYPFYARARAAGDVVWWTDYGMPAAVSHGAVMDALRHRGLSRVPPGGFPPAAPGLENFAAVEARSLLNLEGRDHAQLRRAVLGRFTTAALGRLEGRIAALCDKLVDAFPPGPVDIVAAYATPVPVTVIALLLGVPTDSAPRLLAWSHAIVEMYRPAPPPEAQAAADRACAEFADFIAAHLDGAAPVPPGSLLAEMAGQMRAGAMSRADVISTAILLLNAGHEATVHAIGNAVRRIAETGRAAELTAPDRIADTVEECLRLDPPLHLFTRWATEPVELHGARLAPGDQIACLLGAANRDPAAFPDPDALRPGRGGAMLSSFGAGVHFCLGAPLARLEMRLALARLFARHPDLRLAEPPLLADIYHFHGHGRLLVQP